MIKVDKISFEKNYICSFCGSGPAKMLIVYVDPNRAASIPTCEVCYEELSQACAKNDSPKKSTRKKKESDK